MYFLLSNFLDNILRRSEDRIQVMTWGYGRAQEVLSMVVQLREGIVWKITCIVLLLLGLFLGGCGKVDRDEAQAQVGRGLRTYEILPNTFEIRSDTDPSITVTGEATRYTLVDDGRVLFTANDSTGDRNIVLDPDDIVIERPIANAVTVLTQANRLL
jgi:hypothetical protein